MVVFGQPLSLEAQTYTPTPSQTPVPSETPTPSQTFTATATNYFLFGGTVTPTLEVTPNAACPSGSFSVDGLHPDWAAVCSACLPAAEDVIGAAAGLVTVPAVTIPAIFFDEYTLLDPTLAVTPTPIGTISVTPTPACLVQGSYMWGASLWPDPLVMADVDGTFVDNIGQGVLRVSNINNDAKRGWMDSTNEDTRIDVTWLLPAPTWSTGLTWRVSACRNCGGSPASNSWYDIYVNGVLVVDNGIPQSSGQEAGFNSMSITPQWVTSVRVHAYQNGGVYGQVNLQALGVTSTCWAQATPTPTLSPTPTATARFSDGMFSLPSQDCTNPVYVSHEPVVDVSVEVAGNVQCFVIFPFVDLGAGSFASVLSGTAFEGLVIPRIDLCLRYIMISVEMVGIVIDVGMLLLGALLAFLFRFAAFN